MDTTANIGAPKPERQVANAMRNSASRIARLSDLASELESRLVSVLRDEPMATGEDKGCETTVPLANEIQAHTDRIEAIGNNLNSILERLELP